MTTVAKKMSAAKRMVVSILETSLESRENDIELILRVWELEGLHLSPTQREQIKRSTPPETITRVRRKLNEAGYYKPPENVEKQRSLLEQEHRDYHRNNDV